jgi:multidrug efflux pump subunit AcrA (membrane-fusion protein)
MLRRCLRVEVLLCLVCLVAACSRTDAAPTVPTAVSAVGPTNVTCVVQRGRVTRTLEFTGRISPVEEVSLYFKTGGYVKQVLVRPGDRVKAGDLLAELEAELGVGGLQNQVASAELNLAIAQARLAQAEEVNAHAIAQAEMALTLAQEQLALTKALRATYTAGTVAARVVLEQAEDQVARAEIEYQEALDRSWEPDRVRDAYALALQQARWDLETAQAQYEQAVANEAAYQRELKIAEIGVQQAEAELEQLKGGIDPVLNLEVQRAQQALAYSQIVAPVDGEVISLFLYPGRPVEPFRTVIVIADPAVIEVSAALSSDQLKDLAEGQEASVVLNIAPERTWTGTIRRLPYPYGTGGSVESPAGVDSSTRINLRGDVGGLKLGDLVRVTIVLQEKDDALWLPPSAIDTLQGCAFVIVQDGDRQRRVDVELGIQGWDRVEILRGLEEGQVVVTPQ